MRSLTLIVAVAGAYALLRGWDGSPDLLLRSCLAVATLVAGLALWGIRRDASHPRMLSLRRATMLDYLTLGAAVVFTEACFVVITSTLAAPTQEWVISFEKSVTDPRKAGGGDGGNEDETEAMRVSGLWNFGNDLKIKLKSSSNPKLSNKPEVFMELENSADATTLLNSRIHLRSLAFPRFNGITWSAPPSPISQLTAPITFPRHSQHSTIKHRVYHAINPSGKNLFISLQGVTSTDLTQLTRLGESIHQMPELIGDTDGYSYNASSSPLHFTDLISAPISPATSEPGELDLPPELAGQLRKTAEAFIYEPDLATRLIGLRNYLQDNYEYSLKTTNTSGTSPLENFLYQEKRGYCAHFATAAAMLCRTLGIPSRIAYGWSGGRLYKSQNMFVFRAKDAHAWTEIKLDGYGWVVFDTTPPDDGATPEAHAAPEGEKAPDPRETITQQQQTAEHSSDNPLTLDVNSPTLYAVLVIIGICCSAFLITRAYKQPITTPDGRPVHCPPPSYLTHFKQTCAVLGHPMPTGRTLRQHIDVLHNNNSAPEFAPTMLDYHYGVTYSEEHKTPSIEKHLNHAIRQWKKSSLAKVDPTQELP
jgi:transglutaminase-like putative cysteine protease